MTVNSRFSGQKLTQVLVCAIIWMVAKIEYILCRTPNTTLTFNKFIHTEVLIFMLWVNCPFPKIEKYLHRYKIFPQICNKSATISQNKPKSA